MKSATFKCIKVKQDVHAEMKLYAVKNGVSLIQVLESSWACLKKSEGKEDNKKE